VLSFSQFIAETPESDAAAWKAKGIGRHKMTALAKKAAKGGSLHHLHPGEVTVHRGQKPGSVHHTKVGTSWSKSKEVAKKYADGHTVHTLEIKPHTPAIDVNKLLKRPSKEKEIFVVAGKYKTKKALDKSSM